MVYPRQSLIDFLIGLKNLLDIGLSEKRALEVVRYYSSSNKAYFNVVMDGLNKGSSAITSLGSLVSQSSYFYYDSYHVCLKDWLMFQIDQLQRKQRLYTTLVKKSIKPVVLLCVALFMNFFIVVSLIPKVSQMLEQFNTPLPEWLSFLILLTDAITHYGYVILSVTLGVFILIVPWIKLLVQKRFEPVRNHFMIQELLAIIRSLHVQGMELKEIVVALKSNSGRRCFQRFEQFKSAILSDHSYKTAFHILLKNDHHESVVNQGILSQQFSESLAYVGCYYQSRYEQFIGRVALIVNVVLMLGTGASLLFGFYMTLQPFIQLMEGSF